MLHRSLANPEMTRENQEVLAVQLLLLLAAVVVALVVVVVVLGVALMPTQRPSRKGVSPHVALPSRRLSISQAQSRAAAR